MATILRVDGFRIVIYSNDHRPAHVHVIGGGKEALFNLHCPKGPPEIRENYGLSRSEMYWLIAVLSENLVQLCRSWEAIHGKTR